MDYLNKLKFSEEVDDEYGRAFDKVIDATAGASTSMYDDLTAWDKHNRMNMERRDEVLREAGEVARETADRIREHGGLGDPTQSSATHLLPASLVASALTLSQASLGRGSCRDGTAQRSQRGRRADYRSFLSVDQSTSCNNVATFAHREQSLLW